MPNSFILRAFSRLASKIDNNPETAKYFWTFIKKCQVLRNERLLIGNKRQLFSNEGAMGLGTFAPRWTISFPMIIDQVG